MLKRKDIVWIILIILFPIPALLIYPIFNPEEWKIIKKYIKGLFKRLDG